MDSTLLGVVLLGLFAAAAVMGDEAPKAAEVYLYVEAEQFEDLGGWTIDSQFRQLMGSTYLLAAGIGQPVADAQTTVQAPRQGSYHLWVRCKDWHETSPGQFSVLINGKPSATTFGAQKKDWSWVAGGVFELPAGPATLALHDLTGYYGRCDAIILTTDAHFTPPDDLAALARLRKQLLGESKPEELDFDFVVVGGGYGGVCAAVQAARLGLKTALVQNRPCLGGNASKEINVLPGGACPHTSRFRETGICEELVEARVRPGCSNWSEAIDLIIKDLPALSVFLNTEGTRAVMANAGHIAAVEAEHVITGKRTVFRAPLFADCTGDGAIAFSAGCEFHQGQESRDEFGESYAPEKPNPHTMGTSLIHAARRMETPQPFTPPPFAVKFTAEYFTQRKGKLYAHGDWWIEYGGMLDTIQDAETIRDELIRVIFGAFDWAKNHDPNTREAARNYKLVRVPIVGGKRESRRFIGDYILTQNDVEAARLFPDRVAFGGWPIDIHPSPGIFGKDIPPANFHHLKQIYSIPYRILYTRDVDNLFLAGRHASVTHVALGSTRLMQTIGTMGQAVGAAAYLCKRHQALPRGIYPAHIEELQQLLLKWDAYIPEMLNKDRGDLCRGAKATASSTGPSQAIRTLKYTPAMTRDAPCTMDRGQPFVTDDPSLKTLSLYLANAAEQPTQARLNVEEGDVTAGDTHPLMAATAQVPPGKARWVAFELSQALQAGKQYFVWLARNPDLTWKICERVDGQRTWGEPGAWTVAGGVYALKPFVSSRRLGDVSPQAALNGLKWPLGGEGNLWRSDPAQGLPQWLEVDFGRSVTLNTVYLTFDTNMSGRFPPKRPGAEVTVEDYRLLYDKNGTWEVAFAEEGNWRRFRRHHFSPITTPKIRLEVLKARNGNEARVYEIRAYNE